MSLPVYFRCTVCNAILALPDHTTTCDYAQCGGQLVRLVPPIESVGAGSADVVGSVAWLNHRAMTHLIVRD